MNRSAKYLLTIAPLSLSLVMHAQPAPAAASQPKPKSENASRKWGASPAAEFAPQRTILGWTGDPAHTIAVTWRTEKPTETPQVQFALSSANPEFVNSSATLPATAASLDTSTGKTVGTYRANIEGLKPETRYLYRVGDGKNWGEWNSIRTASDKPNRFRFIYVGDAQNEIKSRWSRVIRAAYAKAPMAAFIVHAGDLVSEGYKDDLWGEWYDSMGFIAATIPSLPAPGNHELEKPAGSPKTDTLPAIWKRQFSYPANGPDIPESESYYVDYQGLRLISLNVNMLENEKNIDANRPRIAELVTWLEKVLKDNPNRWTVIVQHQGLYSMAHQRNYVKMREALLPLYDRYSVDMVLQGHDHIYARSQKLAGGKVVAMDAPGTVYMISVSGPKMYEVDNTFEPLMAKVIPNTQMFQIIDVDGDKLTLHAFSSDGNELDAFRLEKKNGHSVYQELAKPAAVKAGGE